MKSCPDQLRQLFYIFIPGIAIDIEDPSFQHDAAKQDAMFTGYPKSKTVNELGPRMAVGGWMTYYRGATFWGPQHNLRAYGLAAWGA